MSYELKRHWNGDPKEIFKPLADVAKDFRRNELRKPVELPERLAHACGLRNYDKPLDYPKGALLRFTYSIDKTYRLEDVIDCTLIATNGTKSDFPLLAFSAGELNDVREEIEACVSQA